MVKSSAQHKVVEELSVPASRPPMTDGYASVLRRLELLAFLEKPENEEARQIELAMCAADPAHFFNNWVWTYNPKLATVKGETAALPMDLFHRQVELLEFLEGRLDALEDGLIEKSRDIGFTWLAGGWAVQKWLFVDGFKTTFGSRKGEYVDRLGDPDSIFEKIRMVIRGLPSWMLPPGYDSRHHDNHMRLLNPANDNTIRGEAGDDMGRGGRSTVYFVDEAAFIEHAESVDASTSANAAVRIWGSSVNGMGNLFARKRHSQMRPDQVFRYHWRDDPRKTDEWAVKEKSKLEEWAWNSEYELDYSASVEGICIPAIWVQAAQRVSKYVDIQPEVTGIAGLDVGAGKAKSVHVARFGAVVGGVMGWGNPDTIEVAHNCLDQAAATKYDRADKYVCSVKHINYDSVGVGHGIGAVLKRAPTGMLSAGVNVGVPADENRVWPDGMTSEQKFGNLKAEIWFLAKERFWATYQTVLWHESGGAKGKAYPASELIMLPPDSENEHARTLAFQISLVKQLRNEKGKLIMESKKQLSDRGISSPDYAEALMLTFIENAAINVWAKLGAAA